MATIPSMLLALRKIFFYVLLILYLFITPTIILHALGYMIDPGERSIYKTGLVSIVTEPKNAVLYVGGKKFSRKTPAAIHDLLRQPVRGEQQFDPGGIGVGKFPDLGTQGLHDRHLIVGLVVPLTHQRDRRTIILPFALAHEFVVGTADGGDGVLRIQRE